MAVNEIDLTGSTPNHSSRYGANVPWFVGHTEEGPDGRQSTSARDPYRLHNWMKNNGVSYHYVLGNGVTLGVVDTDRAAWCALDLNPRTINYVFAGSKASFSRADWLNYYAQDIDNAAWLHVRDAKKYNPLAPVVIGQDYDRIRRGEPGGIDHSGITYGLGVGTHTDMGKGFPWDVYAAAVAKYATDYVAPPVIPAVNAIEEMYRAAPWLGEKITLDLELPTPDGKGRFAEYKNGFIYWTATTGARPIPSHLMETYRELGYEAGPLGYPIAYHTVLPQGDVQAFEGGVLYRKYGQPGFYVHGAIGNRWMRSGFENGPFGYPISNETDTPDKIGRVQDFENGRILWAPDGTIALQAASGPDLIVPDTAH